jgi:hypothetical protein
MLNGLAGRGYIYTLAEPRFYAVFSLYAVPHPRPAAQRIFGPNAAQGIQIISWHWFCVSAIREPRPTKGSDRSASQARQRSTRQLLFFNLTSDPARNTLAARAW